MNAPKEFDANPDVDRLLRVLGAAPFRYIGFGAERLRRLAAPAPAALPHGAEAADAQDAAGRGSPRETLAIGPAPTPVEPDTQPSTQAGTPPDTSIL